MSSIVRTGEDSHEEVANYGIWQQLLVKESRDIWKDPSPAYYDYEDEE